MGGVFGVFFFGFIMLGVISHSSNKKTAMRRAYQREHPPQRYEEEYLSLWLTFFCYALMEPEKHDDPYIDARRDVAELFSQYNLQPMKMDWFPPMDSSKPRPPFEIRNIFGPGPIFDTLQREDETMGWREDHGPSGEEVDLYRCQMGKRYDELVDLYHAWVEKYPPKDPSTPAGIRRTYERYYGYYGSNIMFRHSKYRTDPNEYGKWDSMNEYIPYTGSASIFDLDDFVPDSVKEYYPEMKKVLEQYWRKHGIDPTSHLDDPYKLEKTLPTYRDKYY